MLTSLDSAELNNFDLVYSFCIAFAVFVLGFFCFVFLLASVYHPSESRTIFFIVHVII